MDAPTVVELLLVGKTLMEWSARDAGSAKVKERVCGGKTKHPSRSKAVKAMVALYDAKLAERGTMRAYRCPHCGTFHIGHWRSDRISPER